MKNKKSELENNDNIIQIKCLYNKISRQELIDALTKNDQEALYRSMPQKNKMIKIVEQKVYFEDRDLKTYNSDYIPYVVVDEKNLKIYPIDPNSEESAKSLLEELTKHIDNRRMHLEIKYLAGEAIEHEEFQNKYNPYEDPFF